MKRILCFALGEMTLYKYFKKKDCLPDPRGSLYLAITPRVIVSVNQEVEQELRSGTSPPGSQQPTHSRTRSSYNRQV